MYPGAKLVTEQEPREDPACCDFATTAGFEKVVSFYETALKVKGLERRAFGAKYPQLKHRTGALQKPPGMKIRIFPLSEMTPEGTTGVETFEVLGTAPGVRFSVGRARLTEQDRHFADEGDRAVGGQLLRTGPGMLKAALPAKPPAGFTLSETIAGHASGFALYPDVL